MDYYSLKMRASQHVGEGSDIHEQHISGAERIVVRDSVEDVCKAMVRRAMTHSKGDPDFINVKIEKVHKSDIMILEALKITRVDVQNAKEGLDKAFELITPLMNGANKGTKYKTNSGVNSENNIAVSNIASDSAQSLDELRKKLQELLRETYPMRGALLYDIATGKRLEPDQERGVRATYMDALHSSEVDGQKNHFNEAIVLATKVANAPGIIAEICISDDPEYVTGYVANKELGYVRIMKMKEPNDPNGGRIFLFDSRKAKAEDCIDFLQKKKVLVDCSRVNKI